MTVEQAVEKIKQSQTPFDVAITLEGKQKKLFELATLATLNQAKLFQLFDQHQVNELIVTLRKKKGPLHLYGESFRVVLNPPTPNKSKMSNLAPGQTPPDLMQFFLAAKEEKIQDQNRIITSLENAVKSTEKEILEIKQKNMELERENKLKDAEFAIERRGWDATKEREDFQKDKERLSGVDVFVGGAEKLAGNPAVLEIIKMAFASRVAAQPVLGGSHSDIMPKPHVHHLVKNFTEWMNQQDERTANAFFNIVAQMSSHPETWPQVKQVIFPQQQQAAA